MFKLFKRAASATVIAAGGTMGSDLLALRMHGGVVAPGCVGVACGQGGAIARYSVGQRLPGADAFSFHPGPYTVRFAPFAASPELGLQLTFAIDAPDPRVPQQRFDLFLVSEAADRLTLDGFGAQVESTVQRELALGSLELAPCTSLDEWNSFRANLNRILYQRYGITVDDCLPVDLGEEVDYAAQLQERARDQAPVSPAAPEARPAPVAAADALALRRLFLELPALASALRMVTLPEGQGHFRRQRALLQRLDQVILSVDTMPALTLAGPGRALDPALVATRAAAASHAALALDEFWSLLARQTGDGDALLGEADRITSNLELHCAARRATP